MKNLLIIFLLFISSCTAIEEHRLGDLIIVQKYVPGTEDLPIYTGFKPVDAKNVVYDAESGRIIDASYFSTEASMREVRGFYTETLPQLGWQKKKQSEYIREGEALKVSVTEKNGVTYLKFVIRPVS